MNDQPLALGSHQKMDGELPSSDSSNGGASANTRRVAEAKAVFKSIRIDFAPQLELVGAIDELRAEAKASPGAIQDGLRIEAMTGVGKTWGLNAARKFGFDLNEHEVGEQPIVIAAIDTSGSTRSVPVSILKALGVPRADVGKENVLWDRAVDELQRAATRVLIFDEFNRAARRPSMSVPIATSIRQHLMDAGVCAVVFAGTGESKQIFDRCPELMGRLDVPVTMHPFDWLLEEDRQAFVSFIDALDHEMTRRGILKQVSGLAQGDLPELLCDSCNGNLRQLSRIIRTAMVSVVRAGGIKIERDDLADAVQDWAIGNGLIADNPFDRS